jgi:hypothetical protein
LLKNQSTFVKKIAVSAHLLSAFIQHPATSEYVSYQTEQEDLQNRLRRLSVVHQGRDNAEWRKRLINAIRLAVKTVCKRGNTGVLNAEVVRIVMVVK